METAENVIVAYEVLKSVIEEILPKVAGKLNVLQQRVDACDEKFKTMKVILGKFNDRFDDIEKALDLANLPGVKARVDQLRSEFDALVQKVEQLEPAIESFTPEEAKAIEDEAEKALQKLNRQSSEKPKRGRRKTVSSAISKEVDMRVVQRIEELNPERYGDEWKEAPVIDGVKIDGTVIHAVKIAVAGGNSTAYMVSQATTLPEETCQFVMDQSEDTLQAISARHPIKM